MKILFFSHYFPPEGNAPATRVGSLVKHWSAKGHEVTVITGAPNVPDGVVYDGYKNRICSEEKTEDGVRLIRVWTWLAANAGTVKRIGNFVSYMLAATLRALFLPRPEVVIATSPQFFCGWAGVLMKSWYFLTSFGRSTPKFVLEIRDLWPESIVAVGAMREGRLVDFLEWLEKWLYRFADQIVTVGDGYQRRLLEKGVPKEKISIVMNGIEADILEASDDHELGTSLRDELNTGGKFICSYIGTVGMACGLDVLIRAARKLQAEGCEDVLFLVVGDGAAREELACQVESEGLGGYIRFMGRRPKEEMPAFLALCDVSLVHLKRTPLFETVMPSKLFEAAGMKRPVLNGVNGDARLWVERAQCGICFEPEDEIGLLAGLRTLMDDPELRITLGNQGHTYVRKYFLRERLAEQYLEEIRRS